MHHPYSPKQQHGYIPYGYDVPTDVDNTTDSEAPRSSRHSYPSELERLSARVRELEQEKAAAEERGPPRELLDHCSDLERENSTLRQEIATLRNRLRQKSPKRYNPGTDRITEVSRSQVKRDPTPIKPPPSPDHHTEELEGQVKELRAHNMDLTEALSEMKDVLTQTKEASLRAQRISAQTAAQNSRLVGEMEWKAREREGMRIRLDGVEEELEAVRSWHAAQMQKRKGCFGTGSSEKEPWKQLMRPRAARPLGATPRSDWDRSSLSPSYPLNKKRRNLGGAGAGAAGVIREGRLKVKFEGDPEPEGEAVPSTPSNPGGAPDPPLDEPPLDTPGPSSYS